MSSTYCQTRIAELNSEIIAYRAELKTLEMDSDEYTDTYSDLDFTLGQVDAFEEMLKHL